MHNIAAAHDLRIAIHTMLASAQMIAIEAGDRSPRICDYVGILEENVQNATRLLNHMLEDSRAMDCTLTCAPGDAIALLQKVVRQFQPAARQTSIDLAFETASPSICFSFDADKLERIAANLLSNALRHACHRVVLRARAFGDRFELEVADDGAGFSQDPLSLSPHSETHGFGLREVQHFTTLHGGTLCAGRNDGHTIFWVTLPLRRNMQDKSEENAFL